jgi:hypothetical protein
VLTDFKNSDSDSDIDSNNNGDSDSNGDLEDGRRLASHCF